METAVAMRLDFAISAALKNVGALHKRHHHHAIIQQISIVTLASLCTYETAHAALPKTRRETYAMVAALLLNKTKLL